MGIPAIPVDVLKQRVVELIADGFTLAEVSRVGNMPSAYTVARWRREDADFDADVKFAMQTRAMALAEEIVSIADTAGDTTVETASFDEDTGEVRVLRRTVFDGERVKRDALRVSTRQWMAERLLPRVFGARTAHEISGADGGPVRLLIGPTAEAYDAQQRKEDTR